MVSPGLRSRKRYRRVKVRTPGGKTVTHYRERNRNIDKCAVCKKPLRGLPRMTNRKFKNLNKTKKTIDRPYGGYMCHICLSKKILEEKVLNN